MLWIDWFPFSASWLHHRANGLCRSFPAPNSGLCTNYTLRACPVDPKKNAKSEWHTNTLLREGPNISGFRSGFKSGTGRTRAGDTNIHKALGILGVITNGAIRDMDMAPGFQLLAGKIVPSHAYVRIEDTGREVNIYGMSVRHDDLILPTAWSRRYTRGMCRRITEKIDLMIRRKKSSLMHTQRSSSIWRCSTGYQQFGWYSLKSLNFSRFKMSDLKLPAQTRGRNHRRRGDRLQRCLPPDQARLDWRGFVGKERTDLRDHLACCRISGQLRATRNMTMLAQYTSELLRAWSRNRPATGFKQMDPSVWLRILSGLKNSSAEPPWPMFRSGSRGDHTSEALNLHPYLNIDDLYDAVFPQKMDRPTPSTPPVHWLKGHESRCSDFENIRVQVF